MEIPSACLPRSPPSCLIPASLTALALRGEAYWIQALLCPSLVGSTPCQSHGVGISALPLTPPLLFGHGCWCFGQRPPGAHSNTGQRPLHVLSRNPPARGSARRTPGARQCEDTRLRLLLQGVKIL